MNGNGTENICFSFRADLSSPKITCSCRVLKRKSTSISTIVENVISNVHFYDFHSMAEPTTALTTLQHKDKGFLWFNWSKGLYTLDIFAHNIEYCDKKIKYIDNFEPRVSKTNLGKLLKTLIIDRVEFCLSIEICC